MGVTKQNPAPLAGGDGFGNLGKLDGANITLAFNLVQPFQVIFLQRRHLLAASRASLIAELHFGGDR